MRREVQSATRALATRTEEHDECVRRILNDLWHRYQALRKSWQGYSGYDMWFEEAVNNARLNSLATYYDLVPAFEELLAAGNGDLEVFYAEVKHLSKLPKEKRHQVLRNRQRRSFHPEVLTARPQSQ